MTPAPAEPPIAAVPCEQPSTQKEEGPVAAAAAQTGQIYTDPGA